MASGLGGLGNTMGMGGLPSALVRLMSGIRPNQTNLRSMSNLGTGIRPGSLSADQAVVMAQQIKQVQQNRLAAGMGGMYGGQAGMVGGRTSSAGLSMLDHAMNRANMSQLQRKAMASIGPHKIPDANFYQQQQHLLLQQQQQQQPPPPPRLQQQQLQQQQLQQQQPQQQQQQQQISWPLQQTEQQPQKSQQTAISPQLSSGALQQQMNKNVVCWDAEGAGAASPQLSSQI